MIKYILSFRSLIRHLTLLHSGYEVKSLGDSFLIIFTNPIDALNFSIAVQTRILAIRKVTSFNFESKSLNLKGDEGLARIGIHFGEPALEIIDEITER